MEKILLILIFFISFSLSAQTDREILLKLSEKMDKLTEQQAELAKQQAVTNAELKALEKSMDKRFEGADKRIDILLYVMIALLTGVFGLIAFVVWDRQASIRPILEGNKEIAKDIALIKEKELKLEKRLAKSESNFKKIAEIDTRFAGIL